MPKPTRMKPQVLWAVVVDGKLIEVMGKQKPDYLNPEYVRRVLVTEIQPKRKTKPVQP